VATHVEPLWQRMHSEIMSPLNRHKLTAYQLETHRYTPSVSDLEVV
jgi:hypothetical protein